MRLFGTINVAFAMYSRIPMPKTKSGWDEDNLRYVFCAFPLIGAVVGLAVWVWLTLCKTLGFGNLLQSAGMALLPFLITGGIHMDGFCDTVDALSSRAPREKKLEILKDPHTGAFALIGTSAYVLAYFALCGELDTDSATVFFFGAGFVLSRILSGISVISFPKAKPDGLASSFSAASARMRVRCFLCILLAIVCITLLYVDIPRAICVIILSGSVFIYYYLMSRSQFGGITGDLAGYFLQICELCVPIALLSAQRIESVFLS